MCTPKKVLSLGYTYNITFPYQPSHKLKKKFFLNFHNFSHVCANFVTMFYIIHDSHKKKFSFLYSSSYLWIIFFLPNVMNNAFVILSHFFFLFFVFFFILFWLWLNVVWSMDRTFKYALLKKRFYKRSLNLLCVIYNINCYV